MREIEYKASKALKHSNFQKLKYIGKCLLINENEKKIIVIGDLHLGYEEALRERGVFIGTKMLEEYKKYLDRIFKKTRKVDEIVLLGDVKHVIGGIANSEWNEILGFLDYLKEYCRKIVIVRGQHDVILGPILKKREEIMLEEYYVNGKYAFVHGDKRKEEIEKKEIKIWVMGNGHPAIKITDGTKNEKYKCFLVGKFEGKEIIICPSFIEANEGTDPREHDLGMGWEFNYNKFEVIIVGEDLEDLKFGKLEKIKE